MCPHCLMALVGGSLVAIKTAPVVVPFLKSKFSRQEAMKENFSILYGKKKEDAAQEESA